MNVLVTGGAGYIGSHAAQNLIAGGHGVLVVDNLFRGHSAAVERLRGSLDAEAAGRLRFAECDIADRARLSGLMKEHGTEAVMHFAAHAYVGESMTDAIGYHHNNTAAAIQLLAAADENGVERFVFSSTCATYGEPESMPIVETMPQRPINPYGVSKLAFEHVLFDHAGACRRTGKPFGFAAMRYFNVAGADPSGVLGEWHRPETHLIPIVLEVALGRRERVTIFGEDYPTADGTCVRDYVHVSDLVGAHALVLGELRAGDERTYNIGIGRGYSVREVIEACRRVTGHEIPAARGDRRPGDPPELYANATKIESELGWRAGFTDLDEIVRTAWNWYRANPNGYDA
ncbi:MAG: UDP-glucose 4-epimerase GalE [Planctomycetota bacterium]